MAYKNAAQIKETFEALPHVDTIWITPDGHHHLHPENGGKEVHREDSVKDDKATAKTASPAPETK